MPFLDTVLSLLITGAGKTTQPSLAEAAARREQAHRDEEHRQRMAQWESYDARMLWLVPAGFVQWFATAAWALPNLPDDSSQASTHTLPTAAFLIVRIVAIGLSCAVLWRPAHHRGLLYVGAATVVSSVVPVLLINAAFDGPAGSDYPVLTGIIMGYLGIIFMVLHAHIPMALLNRRPTRPV
ncbi:MAG TPA: hypothetical protein VK694_01355 [Verrucomicrobiae bacterium]|nr:hypothetical protein [Verrucomicrobiae bacterium]